MDVLGSVTLGAFNMPTESGVVSHVFSGAIVGMRMAAILQFVIATATGRLDETHVFCVSKRIACVGYEVHCPLEIGVVSLVLARHSNMNQVIGLTSKAKDIRSSVLSNGIVL